MARLIRPLAQRHNKAKHGRQHHEGENHNRYSDDRRSATGDRHLW
jgi:hypothetical protein